MPRVGFEPTISVLVRTKAVRATESSNIVFGTLNIHPTKKNPPKNSNHTLKRAKEEQQSSSETGTGCSHRWCSQASLDTSMLFWTATIPFKASLSVTHTNSSVVSNYRGTSRSHSIKWWWRSHREWDMVNQWTCSRTVINFYVKNSMCVRTLLNSVAFTYWETILVSQCESAFRR
jgi:hypothetical protein